MYITYMQLCMCICKRLRHVNVQMSNDEKSLGVSGDNTVYELSVGSAFEASHVLLTVEPIATMTYSKSCCYSYIMTDEWERGVHANLVLTLIKNSPESHIGRYLRFDLI